jgi:hypothetical protein
MVHRQRKHYKSSEANTTSHSNAARLVLVHILSQSNFVHSQKSFQPSMLCRSDLYQRESDEGVRASYSHVAPCFND